MSTEAPSSVAHTLDSAHVEDVMHAGVFTCFFETPVTTVARLMATHGLHSVVGLGDATDGDTCVWGLVTARDVVAAAATDHVHAMSGWSAASELATIAPGETVRRAAELMTERGLSHLLVVEPGAERPLGVISTLDVCRVVGGTAFPQ